MGLRHTVGRCARGEVQARCGVRLQWRSPSVDGRKVCIADVAGSVDDGRVEGARGSRAERTGVRSGYFQNVSITRNASSTAVLLALTSLHIALEC